MTPLYYLFCFAQYYPQGGMCDIEPTAFLDIASAKAYFGKKYQDHDMDTDYAQIVECKDNQLRVVSEWQERTRYTQGKWVDK